MVSFFKNFAKGVLYVLVLPVLIIVLALYAVGALFVFIFLGIKGLVLFFTGRSLYEDLPEDKEAKRRLGILPPEEAEEQQKEISVQVQTTTEIDDVQEEEIEENNNDPFYVPEYLKTHEEEPEIEEVEEVNVIQEVEEPEPIKARPIVIDQQEETIENSNVIDEKTSQNANIFSISDVDDMDDNDDDNNGSGINIDFD